MKYPHILLAVVFFLVLANVHAQDNKYPLVTGDFQGWDLDAFARAIEAGSGVRLYYDPAWSDSICINLSLEAQPLDKVLDRIFQGTSFYYSMDVYGGILVTKGIQLRTDLPEAFTGGKQPALSRKSEVTIDQQFTFHKAGGSSGLPRTTQGIPKKNRKVSYRPQMKTCYRNNHIHLSSLCQAAPAKVKKL